MKILCISDAIDPLIYSNNAKKNFPDIDLILCAGDLPMDYVEFAVSMLNKPTYFIFGNHDLKDYKYYHGKAYSNTLEMNISAASRGSRRLKFQILKLHILKTRRLPHF